MILLILLACVTTNIAIPLAENKNDTKIEPPVPPSNSTKEILKASETGDPSKVEIVKQIRRLNEDGSYTIGYEANDGTFKIESRDVLGNVKGTFGYIADDGEIKRVTYTSNGESTPIPVTTTPTTPTMVVRMNKTVSSTTRRPLATIVYPTRSSATTRGTVIQPIPRRRPVSSTRPPTVEATTEKIKPLESTTNVLHAYRKEDARPVTQISNPISASVSDDQIPKSTTKPPTTLKPVYEEVTEKAPEIKSNGIRRQLSSTSHNHHMVSLQQSMGDDSTDVYGGHLSHGTIRPLFTTTTARPRLIQINPVLHARQKIQQEYQEIPLQHQETNIEANTGRISYDQHNVVTSNPVPVVHINPRDHPERFYNQPVYRRPATVHFRTDQYLRDNPGAPIPIGNTRPFLQYEYEDKVLEPRILKDNTQKATVHDPATVPYEVRPVRLIPIPVDERGVPIQGYQARFVNPYRQPVQRYDPYEEMHSITAPVSTRDFRRLLHILMLRQNRLQALMDQLMPNPYVPQYRQDEYQRRYDEDRYDYDYRQDYSNQNYENQYESQRYVPRRRYRPYDTVASASNNIEEPEYLPVEVREALLLKMLILAINPDYIPTPAPATELTTAAPRKQVRNIQILGEEGATDNKST
ncbi:uncharacterized protein LOC123693778 [Colias croceus]|uniref:uncharacterized protein LOC123693778 n=1 Tax=Colias crocea TaxID=72248 RepID=UPI001E280FE2|nr:uncharacterized protein LOC123693778 [Colias croceus]